MPYEKEISKVLPYPSGNVFPFALECIEYMGGKVIKKDAKKGKLIAQMDKKLFGTYLGDRSRLEIQLTPQGDQNTNVYIFAYPLNAVGQKLMFGARPGVVDTIMRVFFKELEKRLAEA